MYWAREYVKGAINTVISPAIPIESPLIAPSVSPISNALEVPTAWEAVPRATPTATLSVILKSLHTDGPIAAPVIPDIIIAKTVIGIIPSSWFESSIPIGVVTDLGSNDFINEESSPKREDNPITAHIPIIEPNKIPIKIAGACFFNNSICLYNGTAKITVAGPKNILINFAPALYKSKSILKISKKVTTIAIAISNGLKKGTFVFLYMYKPISKAKSDSIIPKSKLLLKMSKIIQPPFLLYASFER